MMSALEVIDVHQYLSTPIPLDIIWSLKDMWTVRQAILSFIIVAPVEAKAICHAGHLYHACQRFERHRCADATLSCIVSQRWADGISTRTCSSAAADISDDDLCHDQKAGFSSYMKPGWWHGKALGS